MFLLVVRKRLTGALQSHSPNLGEPPGALKLLTAHLLHSHDRLPICQVGRGMQF
jgi:hypothetical protein